jgi:maltose O-acetyltransferase
MDAKDVYIYKKKSMKPSFNKIEWIILKLNKVPLIRNFPLIKKIMCKIYNIPLSTYFDKNFYCSAPNLIVGNNVSLKDTYILAYAPITIGNNSGFSYHNAIITSTHNYTDFSTIIAKPITIGNNVWITSNVTILAGVTIGDNTIIGAGSVVTKDIPSGVFAAGNPCKVVKQINFTME